MADVRYEKIDHVAVITLDRPDNANSLNQNVMQKELPAAWGQARDDKDVRAIVFTGSGDRFFCSGVDLRDTAAFSGGGPNTGGGGAAPQIRVTARQNDVWKPVITAVNGHAVGGGLMFIGDSDVVIASENARFSNTGVSIGIIAPVGPVMMARKIPFEAVMRMMIVGRHEYIDAQRALQLGLVSEVTKPDALMDAAMDVANKVAKNSPLAVQQVVRMMWETRELPMSEAVTASLTYGAPLRGHPDAAEGPRAWLEKREPKWSS